MGMLGRVVAEVAPGLAFNRCRGVCRCLGPAQEHREVSAQLVWRVEVQSHAHILVMLGSQVQLKRE